MTIMINIVYKMVVLLMAYCTCTVLLFSVCTLTYDNIICGQFIFFTWAASCKASLAALRLYGYFVIFVLCYYRKINMMMMMKKLR